METRIGAEGRAPLSGDFPEGNSNIVLLSLILLAVSHNDPSFLFPGFKFFGFGNIQNLTCKTRRFHDCDDTTWVRDAYGTDRYERPANAGSKLSPDFSVSSCPSYSIKAVAELEAFVAQTSFQSSVLSASGTAVLTNAAAPRRSESCLGKMWVIQPVFPAQQ
jgi:hypothetical protein